MTRRAPRPPAELVDALQDRIHPASGRLLGVTRIAKARGHAHTPGPWELSSGASQGARFWFVNIPGDGFAEVPVWGEASEANARLMAAAPELLEALEEVLRLMPLGQHCVAACSEADEHDDDCPEKRWRAAIAQARGGR